MHTAEWMLLIGTIAMLVGPLAAIKAASKIRQMRQKGRTDQQVPRHSDDHSNATYSNEQDEEDDR